MTDSLTAAIHKQNDGSPVVSFTSSAVFSPCHVFRFHLSLHKKDQSFPIATIEQHRVRRRGGDFRILIGLGRMSRCRSLPWPRHVMAVDGDYFGGALSVRVRPRLMDLQRYLCPLQWRCRILQNKVFPVASSPSSKWLHGAWTMCAIRKLIPQWHRR